IVLMGTDYWGGLFDWLRTTALSNGTVNAADLDLVLLTDDVDEAVRHVTQGATDVEPHAAE
ncbi:MAG TPA: TIGR00730 family Rossman fold protein, partial [Lapillicoccus sp.]